MFVMMVRGVFCITFPQFLIASAKTEDIFPLLWRAIGRLELNGFHVLGATGDGALVNITHKFTNSYTYEGRDLFFFSDPPH